MGALRPLSYSNEHSRFRLEALLPATLNWLTAFPHTLRRPTPYTSFVYDSGPAFDRIRMQLERDAQVCIRDA